MSETADKVEQKTAQAEIPIPTVIAAGLSP